MDQAKKQLTGCTKDEGKVAGDIYHIHNVPTLTLLTLTPPL